MRARLRHFRVLDFIAARSVTESRVRRQSRSWSGKAPGTVWDQRPIAGPVGRCLDSGGLENRLREGKIVTLVVAQRGPALLSLIEWRAINTW